MSAEATLDHFATLNGLVEPVARRERVVALLQQINLIDARQQQSGNSPVGMRQRFGIEIALAARPTLMIVGEPTAGLDPAERSRLLDLLAAMADDAVVILSTHIVEDVQDLCLRVAGMHRGEIVPTGVPDELTRPLLGRIWQEEVVSSDIDVLPDGCTVVGRRRMQDKVVMRVCHSAVPGVGFVSAPPSPEDVYLQTLSTT